MSEDSSKPGKYLAIGLTGLLSLVVGVGSGLLLDLFRTQAPNLTYAVTSAEMFSGESQKTGIMLLRVTNNGRREAEDVVGRVTVTSASIREYRVTGLPNIDEAVKATKDTVEFRLPFLNPQEQLTFHLLLDPADSTLASPAVELRAKGITGKQEALSPQEPRSLKSQILPLAASIVASLVAALTVSIRFRDRLGLGHSGDQRDVVAYLLGLHGFIREAEQLRNSQREVQYWSIVDGLTARWLVRHSQQFRSDHL